MVALCVEADSSHTTIHDAYALVPNRVTSPELDALLWMLGDGAALDADTATAAAALAWYYADAQRNIGVPVWADGTRAFARITPASPEPWDALARFSLAHPIGLRSGTTDLDGAERRVVELYRQAAALAGPWTLIADAAGHRVRLTGAQRRDRRPRGRRSRRRPRRRAGERDGDDRRRRLGDADRSPTCPTARTVTATVAAPGVHREWDGAPGVQRMVTATDRHRDDQRSTSRRCRGSSPCTSRRATRRSRWPAPSSRSSAPTESSPPATTDAAGVASVPADRSALPRQARTRCAS